MTMRKLPPDMMREIIDILRDKAPLEQLVPYLDDWRCKALALHIADMEKSIESLDNLLNPRIRGPIPRLNEFQLALIYQAYYRSRRDRIIKAIDELMSRAIIILSDLTKASSAVYAPYEETGTIPFEDMSKTIQESLKDVEQAMTALSFEPLDYDQVLKAASSLASNWDQLKLYLTQNLLNPLKMSLREEAKRRCIELLRPPPPQPPIEEVAPYVPPS